MLVYVLNQGQYHPLVRPAILTSALGYTLAGMSVGLDVGRHWIAVEGAALRLALEPQLGPARGRALHHGLHARAVDRAVAGVPRALAPTASSAGIRGFAQTAAADRSNRSLLWLIALGMLLPTMHQSSLGSLMLMAGPQAAPALAHAAAAAALPDLLRRDGLRRGRVRGDAVGAGLLQARGETDMLAGLGRAMLPVLAVFLVLRIGDLALRGQLACVVRVRPLRRDVSGSRSRCSSRAASCCCCRTGGRRDLGQPVPRRHAADAGRRPLPLRHLSWWRSTRATTWLYFPSVAEILVTVGLVAARDPGLHRDRQALPDPVGAPRRAAAAS